MPAIHFHNRTLKDSPYVIDLKSHFVKEDEDGEKERVLSKNGIGVFWFIKRFGKILVRVPISIKFIQRRSVLPLLPSYRRTVFSIISHILALLLIIGILTVPMFAFWGYKTVKLSKGRVLGESTKAISALRDVKTNIIEQNFAGLKESFADSYSTFLEIDRELGRARFLLKLILPFTSKGRSYYNLVQTGLHLSRAGEILSTDEDLKLETFLVKLQSAGPDLTAANKYLKQVELEELPAEIRQTVGELKTILGMFALDAGSAEELLSNLQILLGGNQWQRYLVLFQNSNELRPTGGFIGSYAIFDIDMGRIKNWSLPGEGSYNVNYTAHNNILAPKPLRVLNPLWQFQDCNWLPDFSYSAQKCAWFFEEGTGMSVDGVIAVNLPLIIDLIKVVGQIDVPGYETPIDGDNFVIFIQTLVESDVARKSGRPKQILADLAPLLIKRLEESLRDKKKSLEIAQIFFNGLKRKDLQFYSSHSSVQTWFEEHNWAGRIKPISNSSTDYLHVNVANVAGGKGDFRITQQINYQTTTDKNGELIAQLEIVRRYAAASENQTQNVDFNYLTTLPNLSYLRIYTAFGSQLLDVSGDIFDADYLFKKTDALELKEDEFLTQIVQNPMVREDLADTRISEEFGKTVFGSYVKLEPEEEKRVIFKYKLPFNVKSGEYQLTVQKQPGIENQLNVRLNGEKLYEGKLEKDLEI